MVITLNEAEQRLAKFIARSRYANNRKKGVDDAKIGPQDCLDIDLEGAASEIAFAKLTNTYPDLDTGSYADGDCYTVKMGAVDVKATKYRNGRLLARPTKAGSPPDSYALMVGEFPSYKFVGWIEAETLLKKENMADLGYGPTYAMSQDDLKKII